MLYWVDESSSLSEFESLLEVFSPELVTNSGKLSSDESVAMLYMMYAACVSYTGSPYT